MDAAHDLGSKGLARLIVGQVCLHACMAGMRMAAPLLALREGYSPLAVGLLLALFALTQVFLALPAGRYIDRHGFHRPLLMCLAAAVTGGLLACVFPVFPVLCLAALLIGGATGIAVINLQRYVGRSAKDSIQLKSFFSWLSIAPATANFLGPLGAGLMIDALSFRWTFFSLAVLPVITWWVLRKTVELPPVQVAIGGPSTKAWDLMREPTMRRLITVNWLLSSCWDVHTFVVPVLGHERGISASVIGSILGGFALAATGVRLALPLVAATVQERVVITVAMVLTAVMLLAYPFMPTASAMAVCSVMLGLSLGSVQPMIMSMLHQITPASRHGEALGFRMMIMNASSVMMPFLFGSTGAWVGVSLVFWVMGAGVGSGARLAWRLPLHVHNEHPSAPTSGKNGQ
jgi:MFS family permease